MPFSSAESGSHRGVAHLVKQRQCLLSFFCLLACCYGHYEDDQAGSHGCLAHLEKQRHPPFSYVNVVALVIEFSDFWIYCLLYSHAEVLFWTADRLLSALAALTFSHVEIAA